ncbi:MAG: 50S ribosomal protein L19 [bacterium]
MTQAILKEVTAHQVKDHHNPFKVGDEVAVSIRVSENGKERIQVFTGIVIARRGSGIAETFTVRRVVSGFGVERVFPLQSPNVVKIEVTKESVVLRSSKMYYLRGRIGKAASQVKEKRFAVSK